MSGLFDPFTASFGLPRSRLAGCDCYAHDKKRSAMPRCKGESSWALVISNRAGRPIQVTYASQRFKHYARLARPPEYIHFHSLRHACASWLVMRGESLSVVLAILGHSTIAVTEQYAHLAPEQTQRAVDTTFADLPVN